MDLDNSIKGMLDAEEKLSSTQGVNNPVYISTQMQRLSQYTGNAENILAEYERDYEQDFARKLKHYMIEKGMKPTAAERQVDIELGEIKGQIKYLTRMTASAWRRVGVAQSRWNHLVKEATTQI